MTLTIKGGRFTHHTQSAVSQPDCSGTVAVTASRLVFTADAGPQCGTAAGGPLFSGAWTSDGGNLRFTGIQPTDSVSVCLWGSKLWTKIG